ncbi:MAG: PQQ-binding-like beta-propeller repeat protein, partial [Solirubrobacterales bacterium]
YEMNADTGKLIWKTPVGEHNGHDDDSIEAMQHRLTLTVPFTLAPGSIGGVLTNLAAASNSVYVTTLDLPLTYTTLKLPVPTSSNGQLAGEVEAINLTTGKVQWDRKVPSLPVGAATVSNDLLFTTLFNGTLLAIDRDTGKIAYQRKVPTTTNAPIAIAGRTLIVPAGDAGKRRSVNPQVVAYKLG